MKVKKVEMIPFSLRRNVEASIKEDISKGRSIRSIKHTLMKRGLDTSLIDKLIRSYFVKHSLRPIFVIILVLLISSVLMFIVPQPIGLGSAFPTEISIIEKGFIIRIGIILTIVLLLTIIYYFRKRIGFLKK